ncbi:MAG: hypothetical protein ACR2NR_14690 [Solirubrobacteraceae bacterium]
MFASADLLRSGGSVLSLRAASSGRVAKVIIRDLATGRTWRISLERLIGPRRNLLNAAVAWFAGGDDIAVIPADDAPPPSESPRVTPSRRPPPCPIQRATICLIIVHRPSSPGVLTARALVLHVPDNTFRAQDELATDAATPRSLLLADAGWHDQQTLGPLSIDRITPHRTRSTVGRLLSIPSAAAMAFNPTGTRLLYAHSPGSSTLWLWEAEIAGRHLKHARVLVRHSQVGSSAACQ